MRTALMTTAVTAGLLLAPALAAGAPGATTAAPPSAAPIFYCPKAMAKPSACPSPKAGVVHHNQGRPVAFEHARHRGWLGELGPSARRRAWTLGYQAGKAAQSHRDDGRDYAMHRDWHRGGGSMDYRSDGFGRRDGADHEADARQWSERRGPGETWGDRSAHAWREDRPGDFGRGPRNDEFAYSRHEEVRSGGWSRGWPSEHCPGHEVADHRGGYRVYRLAGRDHEGYLVWSGKPSL